MSNLISTSYSSTEAMTIFTNIVSARTRCLVLKSAMAAYSYDPNPTRYMDSAAIDEAAPDYFRGTNSGVHIKLMLLAKLVTMDEFGEDMSMDMIMVNSSLNNMRSKLIDGTAVSWLTAESMDAVTRMLETPDDYRGDLMAKFRAMTTAAFPWMTSNSDEVASFREISGMIKARTRLMSEEAERAATEGDEGNTA